MSIDAIGTKNLASLFLAHSNTQAFERETMQMSLHQKGGKYFCRSIWYTYLLAVITRPSLEGAQAVPGYLLTCSCDTLSSLRMTGYAKGLTRTSDPQLWLQRYLSQPSCVSCSGNLSNCDLQRRHGLYGFLNISYHLPSKPSHSNGSSPTEPNGIYLYPSSIIWVLKFIISSVKISCALLNS